MADNSPAKTRFRFDVQFISRFWHLLRLLFPTCCSISSLLFLFLLVVSLLEQYLIYNVGIISSGFYKVLNEKNLEAFWKQLFISFGFIFVIAIIKSTRVYVSSVLYLAWREILSTSIHRLYLSGINFYKLNVLHLSIDNPDQRVTQDVDKMCSVFCKILPNFIVFPFTLSYYVYQAYIGTGYAGPLGIFAFFLLSTLINKGLMSPLVGLVVQQEQREGDFRFKHMQIRVNSESLAFCDAGHIESTRTNQKLHLLLVTLQRLVNHQYLLNFAVNLFDYIGSIVSYILLAIPIFNGDYDNLSAADLSALISKNSFVCIYLISIFSSLVDLSVQLTDVAGNTHRIAELIEHLVKFNSPPPPPTNDDFSTVKSDNNLRINANAIEVKKNYVGFKLNDVSFHPPGNPRLMLVKNLTATFNQGTNVLIMGESSSGKTSILRVLKGLWPIFSGHIEKSIPNGINGVYYMASKPVLTDGSLRQQIIYPLSENVEDWDSVVQEDDLIRGLLRLVDLSSLEERTGGLDNQVDWNWYDKLSPGEMQRLCFARLFYHTPLVAVLDEATSAVSLEVEEILYRECLNRRITLISVGHRQSLMSYHHVLLRLCGNGEWMITNIENSN
uniref:ABC transporter domain-containing protein n=1 Tax=Strigamia maritima TaxID=126957 RepID=T1JIZ5_STRMM